MGARVRGVCKGSSGQHCEMLWTLKKMENETRSLGQGTEEVNDDLLGQRKKNGITGSY